MDVNRETREEVEIPNSSEDVLREFAGRKGGKKLIEPEAVHSLPCTRSESGQSSVPDISGQPLVTPVQSTSIDPSAVATQESCYDIDVLQDFFTERSASNDDLTLNDYVRKLRQKMTNVCNAVFGNNLWTSKEGFKQPVLTSVQQSMTLSDYAVKKS